MSSERADQVSTVKSRDGLTGDAAQLTAIEDAVLHECWDDAQSVAASAKPSHDMVGRRIANALSVADAIQLQHVRAACCWSRQLEEDPWDEAARENLLTLAHAGIVRDTRQRKLGRVAVVSFFFNWPPQSGGNVHTAELCQFLGMAGFDVHHIFARYDAWAIGRVSEAVPFRSRALEFDDSTWELSRIKCAFAEAVAATGADCVLITDCWNFKPHLADAVSDRPYFLRQQALELVCPLNNLRLLVDEDGSPVQCRRSQLDDSVACNECVATHRSESGMLHQLERDLAQVNSPLYGQQLRRAIENAEAVLVLNPEIEEVFEPHARRVETVPWGMDPQRFPWPWPDEPQVGFDEGKVTILMAGHPGEFIKGFHVLQAAAERLSRERQDFEVVVSGPVDTRNPFIRSIGWLSQREIPRYMRSAQIIVMPTIAQEGLARTTVEAMAVGRPVVASCIGGIPSTVENEVTGLLFAPGDPEELALSLRRLIESPSLRRELGQRGRAKYEQNYTWPIVIERHYRNMLARRTRLDGKGDGR